MKTSTIIGLCGILGLAGIPAATAASIPAAQVQQSGAAVGMVYHEITGKPLAGVPIQVRAIYPKKDPGPLEFTTDKNGKAMLGPLSDGWYVAYIVYQNTLSSGTVIFQVNGNVDNMPLVVLYIDLDKNQH